MIELNYIYKAKVLKVIDGDTIDCDIDLDFHLCAKLRLRLSGIDTPEINSVSIEERTRALEAKLFLEQSVLGKNVYIKSTKTEKYGRYLADVYLSDNPTSVNTQLLVAGLAKVYNG